ncbi:hypothetical protein ACFU8Q_25560 [Streptomyces sp. NPDC057543]|uniref:hypothetical protein n=1 Tax=Streptomyces sp. NPDC057543 TaxID=3346163 RepID=UPI00369299E9
MSHARWPPFMARAGELGVDTALTILRADAVVVCRQIFKVLEHADRNRLESAENLTQAA